MGENVVAVAPDPVTARWGQHGQPWARVNCQGREKDHLRPGGLKIRLVPAGGQARPQEDRVICGDYPSAAPPALWCPGPAGWTRSAAHQAPPRATTAEPGLDHPRIWAPTTTPRHPYITSAHSAMRREESAVLPSHSVIKAAPV
jgi:hypothetical protein